MQNLPKAEGQHSATPRMSPFACLDSINFRKDTAYFPTIDAKVTRQRDLVLCDSRIKVSVYCHQCFNVTILHYAYKDLCLGGKQSRSESPRRDNLAEITFRVFYVPV